jgi:hypothetical protein
LRKKDKLLRWSVERRFEFIEFRLFWEGQVNRGGIINRFGVSVAQASADLNRYLAVAPGNMAYDKRAKAYLPTPRFKPRFLDSGTDRYLSQIRSVAEGLIAPGETWIGRFPPFGAAPAPARAIDPAVLRAVVRAIRRKEAIEVRYQSLSRPEPMWRWIVPHALGHDGYRWHARAFCEIDRIFKDFLLARMLETRAARRAEVDPGLDRDWSEHVVLEIGPHPGLTATQKKAIALDYGMRGGKAKISVRRAFLYYTLKRLGLDTDPAARRPQDQQIVLLNRGSIAPLLDRAGRAE